jgi:hypothetical protein
MKRPTCGLICVISRRWSSDACVAQFATVTGPFTVLTVQGPLGEPPPGITPGLPVTTSQRLVV